MAEGTYEYECNRAELLGVDPPNREEWEEVERVRQEKELAEQLTEVDIQEEQINQSTGKMDEINNILSMTQKRLNTFKKACGSLTNLLKIRGPESEQGNAEGAEGESNATVADQQPGESISNPNSASNAGSNRTDIQQKMSGQLDKLDMLLTKTENAQYSMAHQTKQIKSFMQ